MIKFQSEIDFIIHGKTYKNSKAVIGYGELGWYLETESQELNLILSNKVFQDAIHFIQYCKKNGIKLSQEIKKDILNAKTTKMFEFTLEKYLFLGGSDAIDHDLIGLFKFKMNGERAYFYVCHDGYSYSSGFGNYLKSQSEGYNVAIWNQMFELDNQNIPCLNDIYDDIESAREGIINDLDESDDWDDDEKFEQEIERRTAEGKTEKELLIFQFCSLLINSLNQQSEKGSECRTPNDLFEVVYRAILGILAEDKDFFDTYIQINLKNIEISSCAELEEYQKNILKEKMNCNHLKSSRTAL